MDDMQKVLNNLTKKYSGASLGSTLRDNYDYVSTGNLGLDLISDGGIPLGTCIEFLGLSQSGKSLFLYKIMANAQRDYDAICILADRENAYTKPRGIQIGIDQNTFIIAEAKDIPTPVDGFQFILDSITSIRSVYPDRHIVVGMDSISAFDKDVALAKSDSGRKAKASHEGLRKLLGFMDKKTTLLVANQVTYKIGILYGDPKTTTAGESMKYYSTVRFALEDKKHVKDPTKGNEVIGSWIGVEVIKTRLGPCYRTMYIPHFYKTGIPYHGGYVRLLVDRGYLKPKNKAEFDKFAQQTVVYKRDGIKEEYSEFDVEKLFEKHPELEFKEYPDYFTNKEEDDEKENSMDEGSE